MLIYDVEVLRGPDEVEHGWANPFGMGFGCATVYNPEKDQYHLFGPEHREKLITMLTDNLVVSFNGIRFDNRVLMGNDNPKFLWYDYDLFQEAAKAKFKKKSFEDVLKEVNERDLHNGTINLDALCKATIGKGKTGHGAEAPLMIKQGRWAEVFEYNINDVKLTWELLKHVRKYGYVIDGQKNYITIDTFPSPKNQGGK